MARREISQPGGLIGRYRERYEAMGFERTGLFALVQARYSPREVLYPGCSLHVTPAFYFPHVVFVDRDPVAAAFFAELDVVLEFVSRRRIYRRRPHIAFVAHDFTQPLPGAGYGFDLLLALYTGTVSQSCWTYLKPGGLLVTNNHENDALDAMRVAALTLEATISFRQGQYHLVEAASGAAPKLDARAGRRKRYLRQTSRGVAYVEEETYFVFRRTQPGG